MSKSTANKKQNILGWFEARTHIYPVHIFYEDTDFSGVVYHANYLRFFERARSSFLNLLEITHADLWNEHQMAFTIRKLSVEYKAPARVDDHLLIQTNYDSIKGARLLISQSCYKNGQMLVSAQCEAACISSFGKPIRAPEAIKNKLQRFLLQNS